MKKKPTKQNKWRLVRQVGRDMHRYIFDEAICPHGVGHHKGVHGCHASDNDPMVSCCNDCPPELWEMVTQD